MKSRTSARAVARSGRVRVPISSPDRAQKLSAAALSKHDPVGPQLCRGPGSVTRGRNRADVYALPRPLRITRPGSGPPRSWAMPSASTTRSARWWPAKAQPTASRVEVKPRSEPYHSYPHADILFRYVLRTGVTWADVPTETIGCSGVTCWRRLRDWTEAGVWPRLHEILLAELRRAGLLDMEDAAVDA